MINFIHNAFNHNSVCTNLLYTKLRCRHSCFADNFRFLSYKYELCLSEWKNDVSFLMGKVQMKLNTLYPRSTLSHTVSELCEMSDENIVWNELFAYDDIVKFIDYICIHYIWFHVVPNSTLYYRYHFFPFSCILYLYIYYFLLYICH